MGGLDELQRLPIAPLLLKSILVISAPILLLATVYFYLVPNVFKVGGVWNIESQLNSLPDRIQEGASCLLALRVCHSLAICSTSRIVSRSVGK